MPAPWALPAAGGGTTLEVEDDAGRTRLLSALSWLPGLRLAEFAPHSDALLWELGTALGRIAACLDGFRAPPARARLRVAPRCRAGRRPASSPGRSRRVPGEPCWRAARVTLERDLRPALASLPRAALHGDPNDWNLLVGVEEGAPRLTGVIDFGDCQLGPRIGDLAIAAAYVMIGKRDPVGALARWRRASTRSHR